MRSIRSIVHDLLALGDLVALRHAHALVLGRSIRCTAGWWCSGVTGANVPGVGHFCSSERTFTTATKQENCHLDTCATDFHLWSVGVSHEVVSELHAHVQITLASAISKDCLALDVRLLVNIQLVLNQSTRRTAQEGGKEQDRVHVCRVGD